jgi:hypothetical protein
MSINEQRIREYAYQIWESEGRPNGQSERHWSMACTLAKTQAESDLANNSGEQPPSTEPIEPISPTQPAQPVPPSDPIQPTDPVQPGQPVQPASPTAQCAESPAAAVKKSRTKAVKTDEIIARVIANEKAAAKKKSAGKGALNSDVKFKTDMRKAGSKTSSTSTTNEDIKSQKTATPRKTKALENELS